MATTFEPTEILWNWDQGHTLWRCGCLENTSFTPPALIRWCGQPDCLRLFEAEVAYTQQQFNWQKAHGADPTLVSALLRPMVTPLPQILPPPSGGQYFGIDIGEQPVNLNQSGEAPTPPTPPGPSSAAKTSGPPPKHGK